MRQSRSGLSLRALILVSSLLALFVLNASFRVEAQSQTQAQQALRDAVRQQPRFDRPDPQPTPSAFRLSAARAQSLMFAASRGLDYLPGEVVVKFRDGMTPAQQQRALMALRNRPSVDDLEWSGQVAIVRDPSQPNAMILAEQLSEQPEVEYAEPNYIYQVSPQSLDYAAPVAVGSRPAFTPSDPSYGNKQWNFPAIDLPRAWDINTGASTDTIVAIVDTGVTATNGNITFPIWTGSTFEVTTMPYAVSVDLAASRFVAPFDFAFFAAGAPVIDMVGHGTHVSSTVGQATNNGLGLAGIAFNARIMPVKVCLGYWELMIISGVNGDMGFLPPDIGFCLNSAIAAGISYAAQNGADVINISLGGGGASATIRSAVLAAVSNGAFVSISNGNDFEDGNETSYPAKDAETIDGAMAVAAIGRSFSRAFYSSTGTHTEIAAPGGSSRDGASGTGLVHQVTLGSPSSPFQLKPVFNIYFEVGYQGTSMAAPHVAGVAALLKNQMPSLTPAQIEKLIRATAQPCSPTSCSAGSGTAGQRTNEFGFGLIQPRAALFGGGIAR
jgi:serine protease